MSLINKKKDRPNNYYNNTFILFADNRNIIISDFSANKLKGNYSIGIYIYNSDLTTNL